MTESANSPESSRSVALGEQLSILGNRIRLVTAGLNEANLSLGESRLVNMGEGDLILIHRHTGPNGRTSETLVEWLITKDQEMLYSAVLRWPEQPRDVTLTVVDKRVHNDHRSSDLTHIVGDNTNYAVAENLLSKANFALEQIGIVPVSE